MPGPSATAAAQEGCTFDRAEMFGISAFWLVNRHQDDAAVPHEARRVLRRFDVADALLGLPVGQWVRPATESKGELRLLRGLPEEVLQWHDSGEVMRRVCEPVQVQHVLVSTRSFRRGLELASTFAMYCARSLQVSKSARVSNFECAEAAYWGVGVYRSVGAGVREEIVAPEPFPASPATPASWVFAETLYAQLRPSLA